MIAAIFRTLSLLLVLWVAAQPSALADDPAPPLDCSPGVRLEQQLASPGGSGPNRQFGPGVISGDTAAIAGFTGDSTAEGTTSAVFIYVRNGTEWTLQQTLTRPNDPNNHGLHSFGNSLALSGDTLVVGSPQFQSNGAPPQSAFVYVRNGTEWTLQQELMEDIPRLENYAATVAISGDTIVVGAYDAWLGHIQYGGYEGTAFVYQRNGTSWTRQQQLVPARSLTTGEKFGRSLAVEGDTIVVGTSAEYRYDGGAVYVFARDKGTWAEQQRIPAPDAGHFTFGNSVALSGDTLLVGNPYVNSGGVLVTGPVSVFERTGTKWNHAQDLRPSVRSVDDHFGIVVGVEGNTAVVGTLPFDHTTYQYRPGAAYIFERVGSSWTELKKLTSGAADVDFFGLSVGISHERVLVGAPAQNASEGAGYIYKLPTVILSVSTPQRSYMRSEFFEAQVTARLRVDRPVTVAFNEPLLGTDFPDILAIDETETPAAVELTPENREAVFPVTVTAAEFGTATLKTAAVLTDGADTETLCAERTLVVNPLLISLRMKPLVDGKPIVNLRLDEEGKVTDENGNRVSPKVEVTVENQSEQPVRASLQGVDPRARDRSDALDRVNTVANYPVLFGVIGPGGKVQQEVDVQINANGRFEFNASVTGTSEGSGVAFNASAPGAPIAVGVKYPVELKLDFVESSAIASQNNGVYLMQPGSSLGVVAAVKNLTTNSTLKFYGIEAEKRLNAFGATLTSDKGRLADPPFPHDHEVAANATVVLTANVATEGEGGAPSGTAKWIGPEKMILVDDESEEETELTVDDVLVTGNLGGWLGDPLFVRIVQDYRQPPAPPRLSGLETFGAWSEGAQLGMAQWMYDSIDAIGGIGRVAGSISADPSALARAMGEGSRAVWEAAEFAATTWEHMSPNEREAFVLSVADEVQRRATLLAEAPFDPESYQEAYQFTLNATYGLFGGMEAAYASDDPRQIAEMWGKVSGNIAMEVISAAVPTPKFTKYTKAAEASKLADSNALGKALNEQETFLRAVKSGPVDSETTIKHWGVGGKNLSDIQDLFRRFGIKGYARERGPEAYRLIDELGEAVWKPEAMKPKGISDVDLLLLNNDVPEIRGKNGASLGAEGITAIFMPEPDEALKARLKAQAHSDDMIEVCLSRAQLRREEFEKYVPEFEAWSRPVSQGGGIPVAKNYEDNGVPNPSNDPGTPRSFRFERHAGEGKPTIYIPKMMTADGTAFKYISGDIDWIHFSFLDGTPLDADMAARLYDSMSRCCGLQHPETISWILNKQTVFKGKINQIGDYMKSGPDQKALLEVSGEGTRAAHMSEKLTRFAEDGRSHLVFFDGGLKSRLRSTAADVETAFRYFQDRFPDRRLIAPFLWLSKYTEGDSTIGGNEWSFTTSDDAILARQGNGNNIEVFNGTSWVPTDLADLPKPIALTPATGLSASVDAGATRLPIVDLPTLWPQEMAGRVASWFQAGVTVIIAPGAPEEEIRDVVALGSLILDRPLTFAHPEGTLVAVLPKALEPNPTPTPTASPTPVPTISPLPTPTVPPTATPTPTPTATPTASVSPTPTATPTSTAAPLQLLNISTRLYVQTGENVLIGGIIITGAEPKKVILRAIGPSLGAQGVEGALQDPVLELFDGSGEPVTSNDNWRDTDAFEIHASTIPPNHDAESAIVRMLPPGNYTAVVSGKNGATGIGLVEVYDLAGSAASQLANISSRGFVETGDNAVIGGFIAGGLDGRRPAKVVIRALGPSLGDQGVSGALADPTLELIDANGSTVRANDDWKGDQLIELEALGLQPTHDAESALIATLPSGNYTAVVRGSSDATGVGLVEVYNVP